METVLIRTFHNSIPAQITAAKLEEAGIETYMFGEGSVTLSSFANPPNGGIHLNVKKEDEEKARQYLFEFDEAYKKAAVCKKCGGNDFVLAETDHVSNTFFAVINRILSGQSDNKGQYYQCIKCGNKTAELPEPPDDYYQNDLL